MASLNLTINEETQNPIIINQQFKLKQV